MPTRPLDHPRKKPPIRFTRATAVAVSDPRYKGRGPAPTVLNAVLIDQRGRAWHWDGITTMGTRMLVKPAGKNRTRRDTHTR